MRTPAQEDSLPQALSRYFGQPIRLEFETGRDRYRTPALAEQRASMEDLDAARRAFELTRACKGCASASAPRCCPIQFRPVK